MLLPTFVLVSLLIVPIFTQRIQGRTAIRVNHQKCDQQSGCSAREDYPYESSDKNYRTEDGYRSIGVDDRPSANRDYKKERDSSTRPGSVRFEHQPDGKDFDYTPGSDHNRKPTRDKTVYIPKPVEDGYPSHESKYDGYPSVIEANPNTKPIRGSATYNSKPEVDPNPDTYKPKPTRISSSGYNPRPDRYVPVPVDSEHHSKPVVDPNLDVYKPKPVEVGSSGYNPRPDRYVPGPVDEEYHPKPEVSEEEDRYRPVNHRPKPEIHGSGSRPRPVPQKDYPKPPSNPHDSSHYPNKDLGGYNDPKDDDYSDVPRKDGDYIGEGKPIPVVESNNCVCVPYYQCREGHIVTDGAGIIDARKKPVPEELPLDGKFKPPTCGPFHVCCNTPETSTVKPYEHRCGVRNPSGINSRLLSPSNKGEADFGEWPWQAAVLKSEGKVNIFQCGGVLIDKFHVLTVAHCVFHLYKYDEYPLKVRLGEWDTQTTSEFLAHEDYRVSKIIVHPEYKNTSLWNDVAILRLEEAVLFAPHIDTICLPKYDEVYVQQNCVVTGWGKDAYKGGTFSNIMKEVALQVIDNYQCEEMLRKTRLGRFFQLHDGFLCAGGEYGLDSCKGDGGGPLVCYRKDKSYALAGIVSWGIDCGQPGVPGVYVKIQKYLDWITKATGVHLEDYWH